MVPAQLILLSSFILLQRNASQFIWWNNKRNKHERCWVFYFSFSSFQSITPNLRLFKKMWCLSTLILHKMLTPLLRCVWQKKSVWSDPKSLKGISLILISWMFTDIFITFHLCTLYTFDILSLFYRISLLQLFVGIWSSSERDGEGCFLKKKKNPWKSKLNWEFHDHYTFGFDYSLTSLLNRRKEQGFSWCIHQCCVASFPMRQLSVSLNSQNQDDKCFHTWDI